MRKLLLRLSKTVLIESRFVIMMAAGVATSRLARMEHGWKSYAVAVIILALILLYGEVRQELGRRDEADRLKVVR